MKSAVNQRVSEVVKFLIYSKVALDKKDLSQKIGYNFSSLSQVINGHVPVTDKFLARILALDPNINEKWILTGDGEMLIGNKGSSFNMNNCINNGTAMVAQNIFGDTIQNSSPSPVASPEVIEESEAIPYVDTTLVAKRNYDIQKAIKNNDKLLKKKTIDELFSPINFIKTMADDSMSYEIRQGDILFIKFLPKEANITSGKIYLIDTNSYGTLVRQVYVNEDNFTLHAFNPLYDDIIIERDDIFNFGRVVHSLRSTFLLPDDTIGKIAKESAKQVTKLMEIIQTQNERYEAQAERLEKEREKRDELINILLQERK